MMRDITIGQHFPGNSVVHRLDPRLKIVLTILYVVALFMGTNVVGIPLAILFSVVMYALARVPLRVVGRSIRPLIPILIFTFLLNVLFMKTGELWLKLGPLEVWSGSVIYAVQMAVRIVALIVGMGILTYTTSPVVLTDAIERLFSPFARFGFPAHEMAMMMTIALRFIPTLMEETDKIMNAQKARGAELDSGGLIARVKALVPVLIPLFLSAFRRAMDLALAMEARCYRGGEGRTRLRQLHITGRDILVTLVCLAFFVLIASTRWWAPVFY